MSGLPALVETVLVIVHVSSLVRHRNKISGCLLVDGHRVRYTDQSCLGVSDCKGQMAVGKAVDLEEVVEDCGRTC